MSHSKLKNKKGLRGPAYSHIGTGTYKFVDGHCVPVVLSMLWDQNYFSVCKILRKIGANPRFVHWKYIDELLKKTTGFLRFVWKRNRKPKFFSWATTHSKGTYIVVAETEKYPGSHCMLYENGIVYDNFRIVYDYYPDNTTRVILYWKIK